MKTTYCDICGEPIEEQDRIDVSIDINIHKANETNGQCKHYYYNDVCRTCAVAAGLIAEPSPGVITLITSAITGFIRKLMGKDK